MNETSICEKKECGHDNPLAKKAKKKPPEGGVSLFDLLETSRLSAQASDESDVLAADLELAEHANAHDRGALEGDDLLHSDSAHFLADDDSVGKGGISTGVDHETRELLLALLGTLREGLDDFYLVSGADIGDALFHELALYGLYQCGIHNLLFR
jgi:hypothetical protein